ncbi:MAG: UpxY family transcription antiterminator [Chitinophagia bacterium]|jgi:transcription antitermination factor NusG|nr:UpxY family transcription antiterminator [Chitinophagia bacterium]
MEKDDLHWFAVYTKPRWEKKVAGILDNNGIENYCPLNKVVKQWSDRKKVILEPLFKSYVFVRVKDSEKWDLKNVNGILNFVYWLGKPAKIKDEDIFTIKKFLNEFSDVQIEEVSRLTVNSKVRIKQGLLMNYNGVLVEINGSRAKVRIETMGVQLSANFDKKNLEPVV